ncbi:MAG: PKD domain-containing protein [Desulfatirhabdiaceae bacterium]
MKRNSPFVFVVGVILSILWADQSLYGSTFINIPYHDSNVVDIVAGDNNTPSGTIRRYEIWRDATLLRQWTVPEDSPCPVQYLCDTNAGAGQHTYKITKESWDDFSEEWMEDYGDELTVDTSFAWGLLDNSSGNPYGRSPITWQGDVSNKGVDMEAGWLTISAGSVITMYGPLSSRAADRGISARDVTFTKAPGVSTSVHLLLDTMQPASPETVLTDCGFDGVNLYVKNCNGLTLSGNGFGGAEFGVTDCKDMTLVNNRGSDSTFYITGDGNVIRHCFFHEASISGTGHMFEDNEGSLVLVYDSNHLIQKNRVSHMKVRGAGHRILDNLIQYLPRTTDVYNPWNGALRLGVTGSQISRNIIRYNGTDGILLAENSCDNTITDNRVEMNTGAGISIGGGQSVQDYPMGARNEIRGNILEGNTKQGLLLVNTPDNIVEDNFFSSNGGPTIEISTQTYTYPSANVESDRNRILANQVRGSSKEGILITGTATSQNEIQDNIVEQSRYEGISVEGSDNRIYNNIFMMNGRKALDNGTSTIWNTNKTAKRNIAGGPFVGGNYWDDYAGSDADDDELGDTPHPIIGNAGGQDNLPLIHRRVNSVGDAGDSDISDGLCHTGNTILRNGIAEAECTLRAAIEQNNTLVSDYSGKIYFDIPGDQVPVIRPVSALPELIKPVIIDGATQPVGGSVNLSGTNVAADVSGFGVSGSAIISGMVIDSFPKHGIAVNNGELQLVDSDVLQNRGWGVWYGGSAEDPSDWVAVLDSNINYNLEGGVYSNNCNLYASNITVHDNGGSGISSQGEVTLKSCSIVGNTGYGVDASGVIGNPSNSPGEIRHNGSGGIRCPETLSIGYTTIAENTGWGIYSQGELGYLKGINVQHNASGGIFSTEGLVRAEEITVSGNSGTGIDIGAVSATPNFSYLESSTIYDNTGYGILAESTRLGMSTTQIFNNQNTGVRILSGDLTGKEIAANRNGGSGFHIDGDAIIHGGQACHNTAEDVIVTGAGNWDSFTWQENCLDTDFGANPVSGDPPLSVQFGDTSSGDILSWMWHFGDGGTSQLQNPLHSYATAGDYTVSLTVSDATGSTTAIKPAMIAVGQTTAPPFAAFTASPTAGQSPLDVQFTDQSTGDITSWQWNFGDGETGNVQNPAHRYNSGGSYTVSLTVTGPGGSDEKIRVDCIVVSSGVRGDMNNDGDVDLNDALLPLQVLAGHGPSGMSLAADVDGDGKIGMAEVIYVLQHIAGLIEG